MQADQQAARLVSDLSQGDEFVCPDSPLPISRALHLARLSAGWSVCDTCASRNETTGLSPQTVSSIRRIEQHPSDQVIRVAAGIRGRHLNAITRSLAGDLITIFVHSIAVRPAGMAAGGLGVQSVVMGFDDRPGSLDIYSGIVTAVRQLGVAVVCVGRSTTSSLHQALRSNPGHVAAVMVTGAGQATGWTGFDVFDLNGQPVQVNWERFGIQLQSATKVSLQPACGGAVQPVTDQIGLPDATDRQTDERLQSLLMEIRRARDVAFEPGRTSSIEQMALRFPEADVRREWRRRNVRDAGAEQTNDLEPEYRRWLVAWYPRQSTRIIVVQSQLMLIHDRIKWLSEQIGVRLVADAASVQHLGCELAIEIADDDRFCVVRNGNGHVIDALRLCSAINGVTTRRNDLQHALYATADPVTQSISVMENQTAHTTHGHAPVRDSLAIVGLLLQVDESAWRRLLDSRSPGIRESAGSKV